MTDATTGVSETAGVASRVSLLTRPGCHLCDAARLVVEGVCSDLGVGYEEVDISTSRDLLVRYSDQIPVTFVDGRQHDFWTVDPKRLRAALSA